MTIIINMMKNYTITKAISKITRLLQRLKDGINQKFPVTMSGLSTTEYILSTLFIGISLIPIIILFAKAFIDYFKIVNICSSLPF